MTEHKFAQGSEWRRWDFCVRHTPEAGDIAKLADAIDNSPAAACGIYEPYAVHTFAELTRLGKCEKVLFPVIGMKSYVTDKRTGFFFSVLFDNAPELIPEVEQLLDGLSYLTPDGKRQSRQELDPAVRAKGAAFVDFLEVVTHLKNHTKLKNRHLIILSYTDRGVPPEEDAVFTKRFIDHVDLIDSADPDHAAFFDWRSPKYSPETIRMLLGDRHLRAVAGSGKDLTDPSFGILSGSGTLTEKSCFLKADTTFMGLKKAISESDRVFIGKQPPALVRLHQYGRHFISTLMLESTAKAGKEQQRILIPVNSGLATVVGTNKSVLGIITEVLDTLGNSEGKNLVPPESDAAKASLLHAELTWTDGSSRSSSLPVKKGEKAHPEAIKYLSASLIRQIGDDPAIFTKEAERIIFSHYPEEKRLGTRCLAELVAQKSARAAEAVAAQRQELSELNKQIIELETKSTPASIAKIRALLEDKRQQLAAHELKCPDEVKDPDETIDVSSPAARLSAEIAALRQRLTELHVQEKRMTLEESAKKLRECAQLWDRAAHDVAAWKQQGKNLLSEFSIDIDRLVAFSYRKELLQKELDAITEALKSLPEPKALGKTAIAHPLHQSDIVAQSARLQEEIDGKVRELFVLHQQFQKYLAERLHWENERRAIIGDATTEGTILHFEALLAYLEGTLKADLTQKYADRAALLHDIYRQQHELIILFTDIHDHFEAFLSRIPELAAGYGMAMAITTGFEQLPAFAALHLEHSPDGTSVAEAVATLQQHSQPKSSDEITSLLDGILRLYEANNRQGTTSRLPLCEQLAPEKALSLLDGLYGLEFFVPAYELTFRGKAAESLSATERRMLILALCLLFDKETTPLVISEIEAITEAQEVEAVLCPLLRLGKQRRQLIITTHNPRFAELADAEQVICLTPHKEKPLHFDAVTGSLENPQVIKHARELPHAEKKEPLKTL